ncbi:cytidine deaminase [Lachnospiraceae bacterium]|nr:cytidine deaminase [Lachnospiraceae bacterium]
MREDVIKLLIEEAQKARQMAYAPYSNYLVGAALIVPSGNIFTGCNVENASYGLTNCAERTAIFKAVSSGQRHIDAIAIVGGPLVESEADVDASSKIKTDYAYPCGACRQVLSEFLPESGDIYVIVAKSVDDYKLYKLSELLPYSFK